MYFSYGWPKILRVPEVVPLSPVTCVTANRDKIIFALLTSSTLSIWTSKPCLPVTSHQRSTKSVEMLGQNVSLVWKQDSTGIVVVTSNGYLLFYGVGTGSHNLYEQVDPDNAKLRRESDELYLKEPIPDINVRLVKEVAVKGQVIGSATLFRDELMVSTDENHIVRYRWDGTINTDYCIDLRRIPFSLDQQASRAVPIQESNVYPTDLHYSPLVGGFSLVLSDGRAAFLTALSKGYDPNSVQGIWAPNIEDATCSSVNHKYRLLSFGRRNAETSVFSVDDQTGALQNLFNLKLSSRDFPGSPGAVKCMVWTPDGCAIAVSWERGGFALWSVFGSLLTSSWSWSGDLSPYSQKVLWSFDWAAEGYQLWMAIQPNSVVADENRQNSLTLNTHRDSVAIPESSSLESLNSQPSVSKLRLLSQTVGLFGVLSFVKSSITVNPSMSQIEHLYLQGEDRLLISFSTESHVQNPSSRGYSLGQSKKQQSVNPVGNNKNWVVIMVPNAYLSTNWPIRYTAMDTEGLYIAVSGRYGLAHYSIVEKKWKLFGNEAQERDFVVVGGMMWWNSFLVVAVYDIPSDQDEIRFYPRDSRLDNRFAHVKRLPSQIMLLSIDRDKLLIFTSDGTLTIFQLKSDLRMAISDGGTTDPCETLQTIDIGALCVHPACVISVYLTTLKTSFATTSTSASPTTLTQEHSVIINVSGRLMILHHEFLVQEHNNQGHAPQYITPTVLASCVEMVWLPRASNSSTSGTTHNPYLSEALWLYCGQEMRVWLPLREKSQSSVHTFISKRIMLGFPVSIYPLTILFEKAIILGAENDSLSYTTSHSPDPYGTPNGVFPFCIIQRTSQVYLHQILRQLIRRNLGYYAWEIARSCSKLPYFPHSLELLLHEVLEEEATSKDPIPDALLPSVIEFVKEFPVYLRAVGQCARKTELALWPHLFSVAGRPRLLFDECLQRGQLDIAATYLLVIQNLESPIVSKKFATQLMDKALERRKWDLVKDLVRFLKAIEPSESSEPKRASSVKFNVQTPPVSPNEFDISMVLGTMQVPRVRSLSTSVVPKHTEIPTHPHHTVNRTNSESRNSIPLVSPIPNVSVQGTVAAATSYITTNPHSTASQTISSSEQRGSVDLSPKGKDDSSQANKESGGIQPHLGTLYVDSLVERHARRMLTEGKLRDLGKLAANLDFHLVTWLRKEKKRKPMMIHDFVGAIKMIHSEFEWPYPEFVAPQLSHSRTPSNESMKLVHSSPEGTSPMKPLTVDIQGHRAGMGSRNGIDSGYNSTPGNQAMEARLLPNINLCPVQDFDTLSVLSEESLIVDQSPLSPSDYLPMFSLSESSKQSMINSSKCAIELRFMQQIMWEAGVLDWSLLISISLKDALGVVRTVNSSRDQSPEVIRNLRDGLMNLALWASTQCLGYKGFISGINTQVGGLLSKLLAATNAQSPIPQSSAAAFQLLEHGQLGRRKTEPSLISKRLSQPDITPLHIAATPFNTTSKGYQQNLGSANRFNSKTGPQRSLSAEAGEQATVQDTDNGGGIYFFPTSQADESNKSKRKSLEGTSNNIEVKGSQGSNKEVEENDVSGGSSCIIS